MEESSKKSHHEPWNKGKLVGQKAPFKLKEIWAIRVDCRCYVRRSLGSATPLRPGFI